MSQTIRKITPEELGNRLGSRASELRPTASPVNTFARPAMPDERSSLRDVVASLSEVNPRLNRFADRMASQADEEDKRRAEADALKASAPGWADAIEKGEVGANESAIYQRVWRETRGRNMGDTKYFETWTEWNKPENAALRESGDTGQIEKWLGDRFKQTTEGMERDVLIGFAPRWNQLKQQLVQNAAKEASDAAERGMLTEYQQFAHNTVAGLITSGASPKDIAEALNDTSVAQRFAGVRGDKINEAQFEAITSLAKSAKRADILDALTLDRKDFRDPSKVVGPLIGVGNFATRAEAARSGILRDIEHTNNMAFQEKDREKREADDKFTTEGYMQIIKTGKLPTAEWFANAAAKAGDGVVSKVNSFYQSREQFASNEKRAAAFDVPTPAYADFMREVYRGERSVDDVVSNKSLFPDRRSFDDAMGLASRRGEADFDKTLTFPSVTRARARLDAAIYDPMNLKMDNDPALRAEVSSMFDQQMFAVATDYREKNGRPMTDAQAFVEAERIRTELMTRARTWQQENAGRPASGIRDQAPPAATPPPAAAAPAPAQAPAAAPAPRPDAPAALDKFPKNLIAFAERNKPVAYVPKYIQDGESISGAIPVVPEPVDIKALIQLINSAPYGDVEEAIKLFDAEFGTNAALYFYTNPQPKR